MFTFEEEILEPIARHFRYRKGYSHIKNKNTIIVDLGCGPDLSFRKFLIKKGFSAKKYIGVDPLINNRTLKKFINNKNVLLLKNRAENLPIKNNSVNYIVGFAFLEHVDNPKIVIGESLRILKKGGYAIFTCPSNKATKLLEFLSFKLGLISKTLMAEHKNYFEKSDLKSLTKSYKNRLIFKHQYFEFGLNNLMIIKKIK